MNRYRRLRDLREDADKTQREIGALLKTTQQQYAKYETGIQEIPVRHLITLADYYGVSVDYLLGRIDTDTERWHHRLDGLSETQRRSLFEELSGKC